MVKPHGRWRRSTQTTIRRVRRLAVPALALAVVLVAACGQQPFELTASGPYPYTAEVSPSLERVAILVTITQHSVDDLSINPADFVARDANHRIYPANPTATLADARVVTRPAGMRGGLPLPSITLRGGDVLSGFVVFDVPYGVRPTELIWRQTDADYPVKLSPAT